MTEENICCLLFASTQEDPPAGVSGAPTENNIMLWNAVIFGPHETPFEVNDFKYFSSLDSGRNHFVGRNFQINSGVQ